MCVCGGALLRLAAGAYEAAWELALDGHLSHPGGLKNSPQSTDGSSSGFGPWLGTLAWQPGWTDHYWLRGAGAWTRLEEPNQLLSTHPPLLLGHLPVLLMSPLRRTSPKSSGVGSWLSMALVEAFATPSFNPCKFLFCHQL